MSGRAFRLVAVSAAVSAYLQVVLGGVVRVTGSGLGCQDQWPLCNGAPWPGWEYHAILEYSHRTFGVLTSVLMLATLVGAWLLYRRGRPAIAWAATGAVAALALEIPLGALVVFRDLAGVLVVAHLIVAWVILALLLTAAALAFPLQVRGGRKAGALMPMAALAVLVVGLTGGGVVASNADQMCNAWPLCGNGLSFDFSGANAYTMFHRLAVAGAGFFVLYAVAAAYREQATVPGLRTAALLTGLVFIAQVSIGAAAAYQDDSTLFTGLHVAFATATWAGLVVCSLIPYRSHGEEANRAQLAAPTLA